MDGQMKCIPGRNVKLQRAGGKLSLKFCTIKHHFGTGPMWPCNQPSSSRTGVSGPLPEMLKTGGEAKNDFGLKSFGVVEQ